MNGNNDGTLNNPNIDQVADRCLICGRLEKACKCDQLKDEPLDIAELRKLAENEVTIRRRSRL